MYPGIDLAYYGQQGRLEYDFIVAPGAQASSIRLGFDGATGLELGAEGELIVHTAGGDLRQPRPVIYQPNGRAVDGGFVLSGRAGRFRGRRL